MQPTMVKIPKNRNTMAPTHRIRALEEELAFLRSAVVALVGEDSEGHYRPEFVREMLSRASDKPTYTFKNKKQFLKLLASV